MNLRLLLSALLWEARGSRGRAAFFTLCLAIGVAAVVGVAGLVASLDGALRAQSRDLLGADLVVSSRRLLPEELGALLPLGTKRTDVVEMPTMAGPTDATGEVRSARLVELRAFQGRFPLVGTLPIEVAGGESAVAPTNLDEVLDENSVAIARELVAEWRVGFGDTLHVGGADFVIRAVVDAAVDRLEFSFALGPAIHITQAGLGRTSLTGFGNRLLYEARLVLPAAVGVAPEAELTELARRLRKELPGASFLRVETHTQAQPAVRRSLERVERYLGLVALLSLVLGGAGVALLVRTWIAASVPAIATLRSLGFRPREVMALFLANTLGLALLGCALGCVLGTLMPLLVPWLAPEFVPRSVVHAFQPAALVRGATLGLLVALLSALPPLSAVWRVSPARVLRDSAEPLRTPRSVTVGTILLLTLGLFGAAWFQVREVELALAFTGGIALVALLLVGAARLLRALVRLLPRERLSPRLAHGLASLSRAGSGVLGSITALGLGVLVVATLAVVERELRRELQSELPDAAPSVFMIDVQPDQWDGVRRVIDLQGARNVDSVPVVMARLSSVDRLGVDVLKWTRAREDRWVLTREQRLTWLDRLPESNRVVAREANSARDADSLWSDDGVPEVSLEREFAERIGAELGSPVVFDVQGVPFELRVTSLREVDWRSFDINFFVVVEPGVIDAAPHFRIAAARIDEAREAALQDALAESFPNVSVIRVRPILEKLAAVLTKLAFAVRALGAFSVAAGLAVLAGTIAASALRRRREAALLRALGSARREVAALFAVEFALVGAVAGALGALGAAGLARWILTGPLELDPPSATTTLCAVALACAATAAACVVCGLAASRRALSAPPWEALRFR